MAYTLITGASGGIGADLAEICAEAGQDLILVARSAERLEHMAASLRGCFGVQAVAIPADLSVPDAAVRLHDETLARGLDVSRLINNAGFGDQGAFLKSDWQRQASMVQVNVTALMQMSYEYGAEMLERGFGRILNVASTAALCPGPYMATYYASKGFVLSFSQAMAKELAGTGVTVTALCPGPTATGFEDAAHLGGARMFKVLPVARPRSVARCGFRAMEAGRPRAFHGPATHLMGIGARLLPRDAVTAVTAWVNQGR